MRVKKVIFFVAAAAALLLSQPGCRAGDTISLTITGIDSDKAAFLGCFSNQTMQTISLGELWNLEIYENDRWVTLDRIEEEGVTYFTAYWSYTLEPGTKGTYTFCYRPYGDLPAGEYRVTQEVVLGEEGDHDAERIIISGTVSLPDGIAVGD